SSSPPNYSSMPDQHGQTFASDLQYSCSKEVQAVANGRGPSIPNIASKEPEVSIVMACLNEARTLATCIKKAQLFLKEHGISGEVIVADNGSTDGSVEIAEKINERFVTARPRRSGEVIVGENGSTDGSIEIAEKMNARVVAVSTRGYGAALATGIEAAKGKYVIMGDSDESYDFSSLSPFIEKLRAGYDLVVGNRFRGRIIRGAMPPMH